MSLLDVAIIGGGPAGVAAAIQLRRYDIDPLLFEADEVGGLLQNANLVENYPGFPLGIDGKRLVGLLKQHLELAGVEVRRERVTLLDYVDNAFRLETSDSTVDCRIVIIASGTWPVKLPGDEWAGAEGDRVFYEVRHINDVRGKIIAVIGAGDAAFDYALNLARQNLVTINNRGVQVSCLPLLRRRAEESTNIALRKNISLSAFQTVDSGVNLQWLRNDLALSERVDYLLIAIGREPMFEFASESIKVRQSELEAGGRLHFIGDVKNGLYRQASISVGDGIKAAMMAARKLSRMEI